MRRNAAICGLTVTNSASTPSIGIDPFGTAEVCGCSATAIVRRTDLWSYTVVGDRRNDLLRAGRWCHGPVTPAAVSAIRGYRFGGRRTASAAPREGLWRQGRRSA